MEPLWTDGLRHQFGAALDMLRNTNLACADDVRAERTDAGGFWYVTYHTLFWCDLYLHGSTEGFAPPAPFTLDELDPAGVLPGRTHAKDELLGYLGHLSPRYAATLDALTEERARPRCSGGASFGASSRCLCNRDVSNFPRLCS